MATPDLQSLYELYRQMYGDQIRPSRSLLPDREAQNREEADVSGNYMPTGGVLGYLPTPPAAAPVWMQSTMPAEAGFRVPLPGNRFGPGRGLPVPGNSGPVLDLPDPHLERLVPDWMRRFWGAGTLLPKIIAGDISGHSGAEGENQGEDALPSSRLPTVKREDRSGGLGRYVRPQDIRILQRIDDSAKDKEVESPPLAPADPADTVDEEACAEEWADARKKCEEGFRGPRGQGPYSIPKGRRGQNYGIEDCARGVVSKLCGGNALKEGLSGRQRAERNNKGRRPQ